MEIIRTRNAMIGFYQSFCINYGIGIWCNLCR